MELEKEISKLCISFLVGTATAITARILKQKLDKLRKPAYAKPTIPDFVDEDWSMITTHEKKVKSMQVLISQPGLLFGVKDPWLASKLGANSQQPSVSMLVCAFRPVFAAVGY